MTVSEKQREKRKRLEIEKIIESHKGTTEVDLIEAWAKKAHADTNHFYDAGLPYSYHLDLVYEFARKYRHLAPQGIVEECLISCFTHDLIEDCRLTYNDVREVAGLTVAEITYALTNLRGKNRKERAGDEYYSLIRATPGAAFVKICDRLANVKHSTISGSSMLKAYRKENENFVTQLYACEYEAMFVELNELLK